MIGIASIITSIVATFLLFTAARILNPQEISIWLLLAKLSGLLGSILISWNYIIATRNRFIEKIFGGLDKAYKVHNIVGNIGFILVVNHPVFLIINSLPFNTVKTYLLPSPTNLPYAFGMASLYILILLITFTIFIDLPYKFWKKTHELIGIVIILASIHSLTITSDVSSFAPLLIWILIWNITAILAYIYKRFIYYLINKKQNYEITEIAHDKNYLLLTLLPINQDGVTSFRPGQFAFFSFFNDPRNEHPFSILESTDDGLLKIGTKTVGQFTIKLSQVSVGTKLNIVGPFGTFSNNLFKPINMLWVSGGIGITPFLTMAKALRSDQQVTMVHSSRSDESKLFVNMFNEISKQFTNFKFIVHYSDQDGHLNADILSKYYNFNPDTYVYICGPEKLMNDLSQSLPKKGVLRKRIIYEDFRLKP